MVREVAQDLRHRGDSTTTATVLAQRSSTGSKLVAANPMELSAASTRRR
jgi:hypothetical protein